MMAGLSGLGVVGWVVGGRGRRDVCRAAAGGGRGGTRAGTPAGHDHALVVAGGRRDTFCQNALQITESLTLFDTFNARP